MHQIDGTHHVSFSVADMDRSLAFYRDLLGFTVTSDWETEADYLSTITGFIGTRLRIAFVTLPGTDMRLELIQYMNPVGQAGPLPTNVPGAAHICLSVSDIQSTYDALTAAGVAFRSPPVPITSVVNRGSWGVYLSDPDGITLELRQPPPHER
jgi:catechol 2,3-dioxygenase-like lactoylglutathione lyase family enzyme